MFSARSRGLHQVTQGLLHQLQVPGHHANRRAILHPLHGQLLELGVYSCFGILILLVSTVTVILRHPWKTKFRGKLTTYFQNGPLIGGLGLRLAWHRGFLDGRR